VKIPNLIFLLIAAFAEISGCYSFWAWLRLGKSVLWVIPGIFALIIFAVAKEDKNIFLIILNTGEI
jgi:small multidrug resistance family-3 protein